MWDWLTEHQAAFRDIAVIWGVLVLVVIIIARVLRRSLSQRVGGTALVTITDGDQTDGTNNSLPDA